MYKDPILKSKKKEPTEIDVTDLSEKARSKIVRASETPILLDVKNRSSTLPDETIEHAVNNANTKLSSIICKCDPIQFKFQGNLFPPCVAPKLYRGAYEWDFIEDPENPGELIVIFPGYWSKEILWVDDDGIWTERLGMPLSGKLEVLKNNGESRELIDVTAKRDFTVITKASGKSYIRWEDEQDFHETWMWTGSFVKGTRFTTTNNVGALPGERIVVEKDYMEGNYVFYPYNYANRGERDTYWYSFPTTDYATRENAMRNQGRWYDYGEDWQDYEPYADIGLYSTATPATDNFSTEYLMCGTYGFGLGAIPLINCRAVHLFPRIYSDGKTYAKFNAMRYSWDTTGISLDGDLTGVKAEFWFTKEG